MDDQRTIADLYRAWMTVVRDAAHEVLHSRADAEDAAQEVFVRLLTGGHPPDLDTPRRSSAPPADMQRMTSSDSGSGDPRLI